MRILQLAQKPQRRGAEVFARQLGDWLAGAGHEVRHAYLYRHDGESPLPLGPDDAALGFRQEAPAERLPIGNPALLAALLRLVRDLRPDVVQANGGRSVKYAALLALASPGRRWRLVYRNIDSPRFWVRGAARRLYMRRLVMPRVDGIVGVSRQTFDEVYDFYRLDAPGVLIPNGIDLAPLADPPPRDEARAALGIPPERVAVLFFGALTAQKRPERFVRLIRRLREAGEDVEGWVLGDGEGRARMEAEAAAGVGEAMRFLGSRPRVAPVLAAADLLASTSDTEGIPAAVLEAAYLGLPVAGFAVGGMPECVRHGETGLLAPAGDEDELLRLVRRLVRDPGERRALGAAGRRFVADGFSMESVGRRYEAFYRRLLAPLPGGAG
ncbi:MAG TPA: glycosyltransferase family 4 protein [Thermoanaerobaculia bacterium]|nr:glycosyltransferase family 4 protein [Thermoanaerobaculia bacterium]